MEALFFFAGADRGEPAEPDHVAAVRSAMERQQQPGAPRVTLAELVRAVWEAVREWWRESPSR